MMPGVTRSTPSQDACEGGALANELAAATMAIMDAREVRVDFRNREGSTILFAPLYLTIYNAFKDAIAVKADLLSRVQCHHIPGLL